MSVAFQSYLRRLLLTAALVAAASPALAANFVVTNNADSGPGSLRAAITNANASPGSSVTFAISNATITLASDLPLILGTNTTIDGGSQNVTISGNNTNRIFFVGDAGQNGNGTTVRRSPT